MKRTISIVLTLALMLTLLVAALPAQAAKTAKPTATPKPAPTEAPSKEDMAFYKAPKSIIEKSKAQTNWISVRACNRFLELLGAKLEERFFSIDGEKFELPQIKMIKDIPYYNDIDFELAVMDPLLFHWDEKGVADPNIISGDAVKGRPGYYIRSSILEAFFSKEIYPNYAPITFEKDKKRGTIPKRNGKITKNIGNAYYDYIEEGDALYIWIGEFRLLTGAIDPANPFQKVAP